MPSDFLDRIYGQHETDTVLNPMPEPDRFLRDMQKPYRGLRKAYIKLIMVPAEIEGAQCVTPETILDAHKGFDYVVIGYEQSLLDLAGKETTSKPGRKDLYEP